MAGMKVGVDEITLEYSLDAGTTWAEVPEAKNVVIPEDEADWRDRTTLNVTDRRKRYGRGMIDASDTTINCLYTTEAFVAAKAMEALPDEAPPMFRATFPVNPATQTTGDAFEYSAIVQVSNGGEQDVDGDFVFALKLKSSGAVTFTAGTAIV
ncbi:hypothetical protein [Pseudophaeobacter sp.]|jgi:hypothetical protein|uniref:hypothetical protein n=1 Tax=Pseudophaeobacter sp. TaxID=1971739 RepID=UPI0032D99699